MPTHNIEELERAKEFFSKLNDKLFVCDERCVMYDECNAHHEMGSTCIYIFQHIDEWLKLAQQKAQEQAKEQ